MGAQRIALENLLLSSAESESTDSRHNYHFSRDEAVMVRSHHLSAFRDGLHKMAEPLPLSSQSSHDLIS
jgi:hypothetical protein